MKIVLDPTDLRDAVTWAARVLPARPHIPVLTGLVLDAGGDRLTVAAFDTSTSARATLPAHISQPGRVILPGRVLAEIVKALPADQPINLALGGTEATIVSGRSEFGLQTLPADEYPTLPAVPAAAGTVDAAELHNAIAQTAVAASNDGTLPMLTGILVETESGQIALAASDRYRLAARTLPWQPHTSDRLRIVAHAKTLTALTKGLTGEATIGADGNLLAVATGTRTITLRAVDTQFPEWRKLLAQADAYTVSAELPAQEFADAVRRVSLAAAREHTPVRLTFTAGAVTVRVNSDETRAAETLEVKHSGDIEIAFQPLYLTDAVTGCKTKTVTLRMTEPAKPALVTPGTGGETSGGEDGGEQVYRHLLMPVRLAS